VTPLVAVVTAPIWQKITGDPVVFSQRRLVLRKLEWLTYHTLKKVWW